MATLSSVVIVPVFNGIGGSLLVYPVHIKVSLDRYTAPFTATTLGLEEPTTSELLLPVFPVNNLAKAGLITTIRVRGVTTPTGGINRKKKIILLYAHTAFADDLQDEIESVTGTIWQGITVTSVSTVTPGKRTSKD